MILLKCIRNIIVILQFNYIIFCMHCKTDAIILTSVLKDIDHITTDNYSMRKEKRGQEDQRKIRKDKLNDP